MTWIDFIKQVSLIWFGAGFLALLVCVAVAIKRKQLHKLKDFKFIMIIIFSGLIGLSAVIDWIERKY